VRAARRIAQGRAKPVDWLVQDLYGLGDEAGEGGAEFRRNDDADDSEEEREELRRQASVRARVRGECVRAVAWSATRARCADVGGHALPCSLAHSIAHALLATLPAPRVLAWCMPPTPHDAARARRVPQVQASMDDWTATMGGGAPPRRGWQGERDNRFGGMNVERTGFVRPHGLAAQPYQVRACACVCVRVRVRACV
jgi:hypothetical protein